jgi:hypothetical protein
MSSFNEISTDPLVDAGGGEGEGVYPKPLSADDFWIKFKDDVNVFFSDICCMCMAQRRELEALEIKTEKSRALRSRKSEDLRRGGYRKDPIVGEIEDEGPVNSSC